MERVEAGPKAISASNRTIPISLISNDLLCCIVLSFCFGYHISLVMYSNAVGAGDIGIQEFW